MRNKNTFSIILIRNVNDGCYYDVVFENDRLIGRLHRDECEAVGIKIYDYVKRNYLDTITVDVIIEDKTVRKCCATCRYYRIGKMDSDTSVTVSNCLLFGFILSLMGRVADDEKRYCSYWKKRPKKWNYQYKDRNPYLDDPYISAKTINSLRKRYKIC